MEGHLKHPKNRSERRHERERIIERRKFIIDAIWHALPHRQFEEEGRLAKYNLGCGCKMCHFAKYFSAKNKRRVALKEAESQAEFRGEDKSV